VTGALTIYFSCRYKEKEGITCTISMELGQTEAIKKAVEAGLGVNCLSRMAVARGLSHGWPTEVDTDLDLQRELIILTRSGGYRTALLKAFLSILDESRSASCYTSE
jgi:DNA-binding transcriptional LysR family regulator